MDNLFNLRSPIASRRATSLVVFLRNYSTLDVKIKEESLLISAAFDSRNDLTFVIMKIGT